jgi:hypothetical protein
VPVSAETLSKLIAAGLAGEALVEVVASIDRDHESAPRHRSAHAMRQERYRQRKASQSVTSDASRDASPVPDKENPQTPIEINPSPETPDPDGSAPLAEAIAAYSSMAARAGLAVPRSVDGARRVRLAATLKRHGLPAWLEAVGRVEASDFCRGQNDRGWKADLEFMTQPRSFTRILEGHYDNRKSQAPPRNPIVASADRLLAELRAANGPDRTETPDRPQLGYRFSG